MGRTALSRRRRRGVVGRHRPIRRHAVLQRDDLPGDAHRLDEPRVRQARLAARLARVDLLPRLGRDCLPRFGTSRVVAPRGGAGWWQPAVNLLGCVFFGISAVAGYLVPSTGSMLDQAAANWSTSLGAACFLAWRSTPCTPTGPRWPRRASVRRLDGGPEAARSERARGARAVPADRGRAPARIRGRRPASSGRRRAPPPPARHPRRRARRTQPSLPPSAR